MHQIIVYPIGNAETIQIVLENGRRLLFDYANMRCSSDASDLRCDLLGILKEDLKAAGRDAFDVVAITHVDNDHVRGCGEFLWLDHAAKYQGEGRIKIEELWVPAAAVCENGLEDDSRLIRAEARYRLRQGKGIRVFSAPTVLENWFEDNKLDLEEYRKNGLVIDAGNLVPGFSLEKDQVEFFVHSPFATRTQDGILLIRNKDAIAMQASFRQGERLTRFFISADLSYEEIAAIIDVTKFHKREERLQWDIYDVPHHCSYLGIGPFKGEDKTEPTTAVSFLMDQGQKGGILLSSSWEIPDNDEDKQPPHRQAAAYYREVASDIQGEFIVTMTHPKSSEPKPLTIELSAQGATLQKKAVATAAVRSLSRPAPRVG